MRAWIRARTRVSGRRLGARGLRAFLAVLSWARLRWRRLLRALGLLLLAPWLLLALGAALTPLPPELAHAAGDPRPGSASAAYESSTTLSDRHGVVLREVRAADGARARWVKLDEIGPHAPKAMLAAEDRRFGLHPGVDPLAMLRAAGQWLAEGRVVSGASTITQQLARNLVPRPRTVRGKLTEMALAIRIEASLSKREILEQYCNRVSFGPGLRGIESASRFYFDKPSRDLSLAEAAALASIPRGPALYDPRRSTEKVTRRRDRVLDRMAQSGVITAEEARVAKSDAITLALRGGGLGAPHLVRGVLSGAIDPQGAVHDPRAPDAARGEPLRGRASAVMLTIDRDLQREIEELARSTVRALDARDASAASVVVIENTTGEILAYVGSPDIEDIVRLGHNDGVIALRQPGSTLKPFLYGLAMEELGWTAATVLPDLDLHFPSAAGDYHPRNYDGRYHGPVRLREALANSYNVPAVWTAQVLGPGRVHARLLDLGFGTLDRGAEHYGVAIALGDGEVRLLDLANAYATLARGGLWRPVKAVRQAAARDGSPIPFTSASPRRVLGEAAAAVLADILSDPRARIASFGEGSVLELPFPVAVKTGTSKGFRDNLTVGFTRDVTVAVWVGNFDGSPMQGVSGVSGAGPLFRDAMIAAARGREVRGFDPPAGHERIEVCTLSGARPTAACPHRRAEWLPEASVQARPACEMHERTPIDRRTGLRAGVGCPEASVEDRIFEVFPASQMAWARSVGRPLAPEAYSPLCPAPADSSEASTGSPRGRLRIAFPLDEMRFSIDPAAAAPQSIRIRADVPAGIKSMAFVIDGRRRIVNSPPFAIDLPLTPGPHRVQAEAEGTAPSEPIEFTVE